MARTLTMAQAQAARAPRRTRQASATVYPAAVPGRPRKLPNPDRSQNGLWRWATTPEVWAVADRMSSSVRRVGFFPALNLGDSVPGDQLPPLMDADGQVAEGVDQRLARDAVDVWATVRSPLGSQADLFSMVAFCLSVAADAWQFGYTGRPDLSYAEDGDPMWVGLARHAIEQRSGFYEVDVGADTKVKVPIPADGEPGARAVRIWEPDPRAPARALSWLTAAADPLSKLANIYEAIQAVALSRMNAGVVLAADNQDPARVSHADTVEVAERELGRPLYEELYAQIADHVEQSTAEANPWARAVPAVVGLDKELVDKVKWLELARSLDPELGNRVDDLRRRVASAARVPAEVILGVGESVSGIGGGNVADRIDLSEYQRAVAPMCERISFANTVHILQATLLAMGHGEAQVGRVRVGFSADNLLMPPDRTDAAIRVAGLPGVPAITPAELRDATGLGDFEGPDEGEQLRMLAERLLVAQGGEFGHLLEFLGLPAPPAAPAVEPVEVIDVESEEAAVALPVRSASATPGDTVVGERLVQVAARYEAGLSVLFAAVVARMAERASQRVASLARRGSWAPLRSAVQAAPARWVGTVPGVLAKLEAEGVPDSDLFGGALAAFADEFALLTRRAQQRAVREAGGTWDDLEADAEQASAAAWALGGRLLIGEARRRFEGRLPDQGEGEGAGPDPFDMPTSLVRRVSAVAGGDPDQGAGGARGVATAALASVATGLLARRALASADREVVGWLWDWEIGGERNPYPPHEDLHGAFSTDENDFGGYFVGDHNGCECQAIPVLAPVSEEATP